MAYCSDRIKSTSSPAPNAILNVGAPPGGFCLHTATNFPLRGNAHACTPASVKKLGYARSATGDHRSIEHRDVGLPYFPGLEPTIVPVK